MTKANVIELKLNEQSKPEDYSKLLEMVITEITTKMLTKQKVEPYEYINNHLIASQDNTPIRDLFVSQKLMTAAEFNRAIDRLKKNTVIIEALGFVPKTARQLVDCYAKKNKTKALLNGVITREPTVYYKGQAITDQDRHDSKEIDIYYRVKANTSYGADKMRRDVRLLRDELVLGFNDSQIADAVKDWIDESVTHRRIDIFLEIAYEKGKATGPEGEAMWLKMEKACFETSATVPGFAIAIIKKFMWQVKRKGLGLPVTNHLMPVITGPQGGGKSTFVNNMMRPISDAMKTATFVDISDNRLIDLWSTPVLFMDEMSGARKANMNDVKQAITAISLTRRPMKSNSDEQVPQLSTFIGCSNNSLGEIIRDDTGIRRFAELEFLNDPDWKAMNDLDWKLMWRSVDENGLDPSRDFNTILVDQQEKNRNLSPIELWAIENSDSFKKWTTGTRLYEVFSLWEQTYNRGTQTSNQAFFKTMMRLIRQKPDFPWEHRYDAGVSQYKNK